MRAGHAETDDSEPETFRKELGEAAVVFDIMVVAIATVIRILWLLVEVRQSQRSKVTRGDAGYDWDKKSGTVWDAANTIEIVGLVLAYLGVGRIDQLPRFVPVLGLVLLSAGIVIRLTAIQKLGAFFTSVVTIREDHQIIRTGLYRYIRHPGYTGALIAHAGLGLAFGSIVSITLSTVPFIAAALYRMRDEEEA